MPPTQLRRDWTIEDRSLAVALMIHEQSIGACGHPHTATMAPGVDLDGWFKVDDDRTCPACAELDRYRRDNDGDDAEPGVQLRVVNLKDHPELE